MSKKKWIAYGVTGMVGLGVVAGAAAATASTIDMQTTEGTIVPGGVITNSGKDVLDTATVQLQQTNSAVTVVTAPSAATVTTPATPASPATAPTPASAPSPATPASPASPASPTSPASAASPASVASAGSD